MARPVKAAAAKATMDFLKVMIVILLMSSVAEAERGVRTRVYFFASAAGDVIGAGKSRIIESFGWGVPMLDKKLLSILVCPVSKAPLEYDAERDELICKASGLAYPVRDGIPVMLEEEARQLTADEKLG